MKDPTRQDRSADRVFLPVRSRNAFEETVERLAQAIRLGGVRPGEPLPPERDLVALLQVSRSTLREAVQVLKEAGYLAAKRGRYGGTFVVDRPLSPSKTEVKRLVHQMGEDLFDALDYRRVLEVGSAELAAERVTSEGRQRLEGMLETMHGLEPSAYRKADSQLHLAIAELADVPSLVVAVAEAHMRIVDLLEAIPVFEYGFQRSDEQHARVVKAIATGTPDQARKAMAEHCEATSSLLRGFLS